MPQIEISDELFERLETERYGFTKSINMDYNVEETIWELLKIAGGKQNGRSIRP